MRHGVRQLSQEDCLQSSGVPRSSFDKSRKPVVGTPQTDFSDLLPTPYLWFSAKLLLMNHYFAAIGVLLLLALPFCTVSWLRRLRIRRKLKVITKLGFEDLGIAFTEKDIEALSKPIDYSHVKRLRPVASAKS